DRSAWVWLTGGAAPPAGGPASLVTLFRKEITLADSPKLASAWVSADWHYRLYINGRQAGQGPADAGEDYPGGKSEGKTGLWFCDHRDLTPLFHKGRNSIALEVFTERIADWYGSSGARGLFFDMTLTGADGAVTQLKSDDTWRAQPAQFYGTAGGRFQYLPAKEPADWRTVGFDDSAWGRCGPAGDHWPGLRRSEIPPPMELVYPILRTVRVSPGISVPDHPFQNGHGVTVTQDGHFALQYDRVLSGFAGLKINGGDGALLTVEMNERNNPGGRRSAAVALTGGIQYFQTPFYSSFTVLNITVSGVKAPFTIEDVSAIYSSQPVPYRGSFACSDERMTRLWAAARWSTQLCMQDHYLDSPDHQEPICDPGDYLIESLLNDYAFGEPWLARQDLRKFGALLARNHYINFHTSYSLLWLQMLMDDYDYTGDATLVRELAPQVYGLLDRFTGWRGMTGLISEAPDYMFMDWVNIAGFGVHHPPAVIGQGYMTAFYYRALGDGERVAGIVGNSQQRSAYEKLRTDVAAAFNRELWSAETGLYRDGKPFVTSVKPGPWLPADTDIQTFSPHVNTLAVLYDLAPPDRLKAIMQKIMSGGQPNTQPYFMHFVLSALAHAGLFDDFGTAQMRRWHIDSLTGTFQEMWNSGDWSHGWGGTPLYQLSSKVLGVTPLEPGFRTISIRPTLCDLEWAGGTVPTPHGSVKVAWSITKGGMRLDITLPPGTSAVVEPPLYRFRNPKVTVNGKAKHTGDSISIGSGSSQFLVTGDFVPLAAPPSLPAATAGVPPALAQVNGDSAAAFEADVVKNDLIHPGPAGHLLRMADHASSAGGTTDASPLLNGTSLN
nr:hypothetical protein [Armatimonadota bacterium]